ncbi:hypothetical protein F8M41_013315 [Gigaspora margarita]|uniref:Uncharacterized protein n=1 Tax=Gigaspora margarita TaxID=4874 RepID=A0A8H4B3X5_GIGMA|nr:hypothetical protein F8M41_013315 [Gigaspora margarita]
MEKFGALCKFTEYKAIIDLLDNIILVVLDIYAVLFRSGSFDEYLETIFRIWTFALRWKRKNYNKAPLAFLSDIFYWEQNNHPIKEAIKLFLVNFNDYWIENIHSRIRASTICKDNTNNIQKQAYLLDANKHSAFKEAFMNTKHYPYSPSELDFLTNKTYEKVLLAGYHTTYPPIFNSCDHCYKLFEQDSDGTILIYGHGYHWNCYNQIEFKCKHCINYFKEGIWNNITAFVKRLEVEDKDKLTKEDLEDDEDDENEDDDTNNLIKDSENIEINEKEKIELDLQNAISKINMW